jgi:valyl-tRNA synthetase
MKMEKKYKPEVVEKKWLESWGDSFYYFDETSDNPPYIIDTPPPYPTGDFHVGNALNWCYIDFIARYKRMRGYNVMFPQGWDCHGLPTEVKVEERHGLSKRQIDKQEFRELCKQLTRENIAQMKGMMQKLGMSIDWNKEFVTMDDRYKRFTQLSFLKMYHDGMIYQEEHPVNWCPRCETAIAFAEVEYEDRGASLNYILFRKGDAENEYVEIATTRPELLASCVAVAVHPDDERYTDIAGKELVVPIFEHTVTVYEDESVDPAFGTGVVMICTFGDRQDVRWWKLHNLPLIESIDERGRMTDAARGYEGLSVKECKNRIIADLDAHGLLKKREQLQQSVGVCWRCKTPIEIISTRQWFVRVLQDDIIKASEAITWYPEHFAIRLKNWVESMEWDWCISRQRIFSVPIPVWYCLKCGTVKGASEDDLPVDPAITSPKEPCVNCGGTEFKGEEDVLDTWMDSSLSALWVAGWDLNAGEPSGIAFPVALRPQGHDIIRTWAFYTILRSLALAKTIPWDTILINGMVLGEDGYKMSKSRNNFISPDEVIQTHGADVFRQWAAIGGAVGSDVQFQWKDIVAASKFMQKLWSILRFAMFHLSEYHYEEGAAVNLRAVDKWLLSKLNKLVLSVTDSMEHYKFDEAMKEIRAFAWNVLADDYIEMAKSRLYGRSGDEGKESAKYALYVTLLTLSKLIAPFAPFFAEEMYSYIENDGSVHTAHWPEVKQDMIDVEAEVEGSLIADIVRAVRRYKSEQGIPLNAPLGKLEIYTADLDTEDLENAAATKVTLCTGQGKIETEGTILDVNGTNVRIIKE